MSSEAPIFVLNQPTVFNLATSSNGASIDVKNATYFSLQPVASGSSILGSVQLQGSHDQSNWGNVGSAINLATGNFVPVNLGTLGLPFLRVSFTGASGVGSVTVYISGKI